MQEIVVIDGEITLENVLDGEVELEAITDLDPEVVLGTGGITPTGTKSILLTEAGTKTEDVTAYASAEINAVTDASASGAIASFSDGAEDVPMDSCVMDIEPVQSGSGDPSPSNVRPIGGWDTVRVNVTSKNLFTTDGQTTGSYINSSQVISSGTGWNLSDYISVAPNQTYTFQPNSAEGNTAKTWFFDKDKNGISYIASGERTFTTPINCVYMRFSYRDTSTDIQLELGSTATAYEPYSGHVYPVSLGQTVYGGTLDAVTGVLTVDRLFIEPTSCSEVGTSSGGIQYARISISPSAPSESASNQHISSAYQLTASAPSSDGYFRVQPTVIFVYDNRFTDKATADSILASEKPQFVYELATPTTVQLTPTEVTTLFGSNNVWADSGNISVGYKADVYLSDYPHYGGSYTVTPSSSVQTLQTADMVMDNDVTIQAVTQGSATTPATIINASPTISVDSATGQISATVSTTQQITPTVVEGYVSSGTPGNVGITGLAIQTQTTQGATTYYPSTVDQIIDKEQYLTGYQTIKAVTVSGLSADKVLQGTTVEIGDAVDSDRIMKVVGTASGGGGLISLIDTITVNADTRAINLDLTPYNAYDVLLISENVTLNTGDWLYYVRNGSTPSGGSYNNGSKKDHTGIAFWRLPLGGSTNKIFGQPANTNYSNTLDYSTGTPTVTNVYIYTYSASNVIKAGSTYKVYGGNYADF